jgi:hypothetical protein
MELSARRAVGRIMRVLVILLVLLPSLAVAGVRDGVNAVLGDDSYVARFGRPPGPDVDPQLRLRVHLEYVERLLRAADTSALAPDLQRARAHNLELLHAYHRRGVFPANHTVPGRRPHFIDEAGRICAVGYLIEQTAGRALAEAINARHEWSYLPDIHGAEVEQWIASSGLSVRELAMIQPSYGWEQPPRPPPPPPFEEPPATLRETVIARINSASFAVQTCANAIGLGATTMVRFTVDVSARGIMTPGVTKVGSDAFTICAARAAAKHLGAYSTRTPIKPTRITHQLKVIKAIGKPLDREATGATLQAALGACKDPQGARIFARISLDPSGALRLIEITSASDIDPTSCARNALALLPFAGFRGKPTELSIVLD